MRLQARGPSGTSSHGVHELQGEPVIRGACWVGLEWAWLLGRSDVALVAAAAPVAQAGGGGQGWELCPGGLVHKRFAMLRAHWVTSDCNQGQ